MAAATPAAEAPAAVESERDALRHLLLATSKYLICSALHFVLYLLFFFRKNYPSFSRPNALYLTSSVKICCKK
jgi:hypothetical protein